MDDGVVPTKKQRKEKAKKEADFEAGKDGKVDVEAKAKVVGDAVPKIQPGETLAQYGLRIDQAMPLSSLPKANVNANASLPADLREKEKKSQKLTKHNKRLARMQQEWRNTEAKLKAKEEEEAEENVEKIEEEKLLWDGVRTTGKKGKKKLVDDDPWKELEKKRRNEEGRKKGVSMGLNARDQVQAPPELNIKKLNPFKERLAAPVNVSSGADGSTSKKSNVRRKDDSDTIRRNHIEATKRSLQGNRFGVPV